MNESKLNFVTKWNEFPVETFTVTDDSFKENSGICEDQWRDQLWYIFRPSFFGIYVLSRLPKMLIL